MDLVKSYSSEVEDEDSDIEEIKKPTMSKAPKVVDVINLDSDSDTEATVQNAGTKAAVQNVNAKTIQDASAKTMPQDTSARTPVFPEDKSGPDSDKTIDCIDLVDTESLPSLHNTPVKESQPKEISKSLKKKIDYLNLEDSDTEDEIPTENNDVSALMDSASTLSDVAAGPQRAFGFRPSVVPPGPQRAFGFWPSVVPPESMDFTETSPFKNADTVMSKNIYDTVSNSSRNKPYIRQCDRAGNSLFLPARKHFKTDPDFHSELDNSKLENNESLYREDYHVLPDTEDLLCRIPRQVVQTYNAHGNIVTSLEWCIKKYSYLFLSSSLDGTVKVWDLFRKKAVQCLKYDSPLSAAKWSLDGGQIVTGGSQKKACVYDVESARKIVEYDMYNIVTSIDIHPYTEDVFVCGTRNGILGFDMRVNSTLPIRAFFSNCEEVLDLAFIDESQFICSTNVVSKDSADRTIMVWHFGSGAKLSNQIYLERFTCPSIKVHPHDSSFIAQSNGNYIAAFSANKPYKIKNKRYVGHKVAGYGIECDISPDGKYVVSGDAEGRVHFYNCSNTNQVFVAHSEKRIPVNRVKWHPALCTTLVTSSYDGQINIWK